MMLSRQLSWIVLASGVTTGAWAAATDPDPLDRRIPSGSARTTAASSSADTRSKSSVTAKGPLPDPALLDGSNQPAEKKAEYGMLGEFEMPGSEEKSDKAGGSSQQSGGGGQKSEKSAQEGGGGGQQQSSEGGGGSSQSSSQSGAGGSASGAEPDSPKASSSAGGQGDPNAKAEGAQSSGLSSPDGGAAMAQSEAMPAKPGQQKIGDATMQIKTMPAGSASSVVGMQQPVGKDAPQSYDSKTPSGGKQSGGSGNKGVEKGRTMPAGL